MVENCEKEHPNKRKSSDSKILKQGGKNIINALPRYNKSKLIFSVALLFD